jgi:tetratricopeptide (TPR) repeat protein
VQDSYDRLQAALAGRYTLLREIGRGGMAVVYLADDTRHGRRVAVKAIRPDVLHALGSERFEREISIAAHLAHPHVLPLFDSGTASDTLFFVMPYVEGESLRDRLRRERQLSIADAVQISRDVASALAYAHGQGVIHRDIKPENILLEGGEALVADFGLARAIARSELTAITDSGIVVGTPTYMSPEQAQQNGVVDGRSDVYALGCVLYEMVAGEPPFTGATAHAVLARHLQEAPTPLHVLRPGTPAWLDGLVARMLAKIPADRPAGAAEVLRILTESASGVVGAVGAAASGRRWRIAVLAAGAVLLGVAGWWLLGPNAASVDPHHVVVFPARATGGSGMETGFAEGFSASLIASLNGTEVIHAVEGRGDVTAGAREAVLAGAGSWVESSLIAGDSLRLSFVLHRRGQRDARAHALAFAAGTDAWQVGLAAAKVLLADLLDVSPDEALPPVLQGRTPFALAHFFQGEARYRRAAFAQALVHFEASVGADSGFSYAALRGAQAANWLNNPVRGGVLLELAMRHVDDLPPRHAAFARGLTAYLEGRADSAVSEFGSVLRTDPSALEDWMALGETFAHLLPRDGSIDSLAEDAFRRVRALDSTFVPALPHLIEAAARRGDTERAATLLRAFSAGDPDTVELGYLNLVVQCVRSGPKRVNWQDEMIRRPGAVLNAAQILTSGGLRQPECAQAAWTALSAAESDDNSRFSAMIILQGIHFARGDTIGARAIVETDTLFSLIVRGQVLTLNALAGSSDTAAADRFTKEVLALLSQRPDDVSDGSIWLAGVWLARRGRVPAAEAMHGLAVNRRGAESPMARSLSARLLLARGDTTAAITSLAANPVAAAKEAIPWFPWESLVADRILLAQLYLARNRPNEAIAAASVVDAPAVAVDIVFLPQSLGIRITAAQAVGDQQLTRESRGRLTLLEDTALP